MKKIILSLSLFTTITAFSQETTTTQDNINAKKTLQLGKVKITEFQKDTSLTDTTKAPTSKAVRDFVAARVSASAITDHWKKGGNAGTTPGTDFIGTTDNQDLVFKRNSIQSARISSTNTSFGNSSFRQAATGVQNTVFGASSLTALTFGNNNSVFGYSSASTTSGSANSSFGSGTLSANTTGGQNSAFGVSALLNNTTGSSNSAFGNGSLQGNTTGGFNVGIGIYSGSYNTTESHRIYLTTYDRLNKLGDTTKSALFIDENSDPSLSRAYVNSNIYFPYTVGIGTTSPTALFHVLQSTPTSVGTTSVTATASPFKVLGGNGASTNNSGSTVSAGNAGSISITGGNGGSITGTPTTGIGGAGSSITILAGDGGLGTAFGGAAGSVEVQGGTGGGGTLGGTAGYAALKAGNAGSTGNANGGNIYIVGGIKNGSGSDGDIFLGLSPSGTIRSSVGIGVTSIDPSAKLEISSTTKGVLLPRMTTTQKNAIASPAEGLEVYDLTLHQKSYYNGTAWVNY